MSKAIMVCSGGGHLKQLFTLAERLGVEPDDQVWITFENGLSTSLLQDREVHFAPFVAPRDLRNLWRLRTMASEVLDAHTYDRAFSTGSSPAVAVLPLAVRRGATAHYIESAARADGPSMSGKIVSRFRKIHTYTQYPAWEDDRWAYGGSIYDSYAPGPVLSAPPARIRKAVVTVGTQEGYDFDRLLDAVVPLLADADEVLWQTGSQDVARWGITGRERVPHSELNDAVREADVVIAHSGTGSAITAFENGKFPILVPRLAEHGEHIDDHQVQIAGEMQRRGLAYSRTPDVLDMVSLLDAAQRTVVTTAAPPIRLAV